MQIINNKCKFNITKYYENTTKEQHLQMFIDKHKLKIKSSPLQQKELRFIPLNGNGEEKRCAIFDLYVIIQ